MKVFTLFETFPYLHSKLMKEGAPQMRPNINIFVEKQEWR